MSVNKDVSLLQGPYRGNSLEKPEKVWEIKIAARTEENSSIPNT
jgi:hypothetical protein